MTITADVGNFGFM